MLDVESDTDFQHIEKDSRTFFLAFVDETIPICRAMRSAYTVVDSHFGQQIVVIRAHAMKCPALVAHYGVQVVPMNYLFADRSLIWERAGGLSASELVAKISGAIQRYGSDRTGN